MNCPNCHATVQPGTRFCIACGTSLQHQPAVATAPLPALIETAVSQPTAILLVPAAKTKGTALAIEAIASIFGIFGAGWLYSGNTVIGVLLLIAGFCWDVLALITVFFSLGFGIFCIVPLHFLFVLGAVLLLSLALPKTA